MSLVIHPQLAAPLPAASPRARNLACALLILAPAGYDVASPGVNASILFLLPLFLHGLAGHRRTVRRVTALLVLLTYTCYFAKAVHFDTPAWSYRLLNRSFVAASLLATGAVLDQVLKHRQSRRPVRTEATDDEQPTYDAILVGSQQIAAGVAAVLLALALFAVDLTTPGQYNLPVLFPLPLLLAASTRSRRWIWTLAVLLVLLAIAGWILGPRPTVPPEWFARLIANRSLACAALLALASLLPFRTPRLSPLA